MGEIYCIRNKINGKCYVGQTINTFSERYNGGKWWKYTNNPKLVRSYQKYGEDAFCVEILAKDLHDIESLNKSEEEFAVKLNAYHPKGFNLKGCGDNRRHSQETRARVSKPVACSNGKVYESISAAAKDLGISQGRISNFLLRKARHVDGHSFAWAQDGIPAPPKDTSKYNTPIRVKCSNGQIYDSVWAASKALGVDDYGILKCLDGRRKEVKGLRFCKDNEELPKFPKIYCSNGQSFDSLRDAEKALNCARHGISACCKGKKETYAGYKFWIGYE